MAGRPPKLTTEVHERIVAYVRAGAFTWVAAEAAGVSRSTFYRWLERGDRESGGRYHRFAADVREARAQARVTAEAEVRRTNPFGWLRYGPGRERPDEPGWTDQKQVTGLAGGPVVLREVNDDELQRIARRILQGVDD